MSIDIIRPNLTAIYQQISDAAIRSGRNAADVKLVAVTKYAEWSWIEALHQILCSNEHSVSSLPASEQRERHPGHEPAGSIGSRAIQPPQPSDLSAPLGSSLPASEQRERRPGHEPVGSIGSRAFRPLFGENRPQQLAERQQKLPDVEWHLIGQLQRNKVKLALQHASMIHSVDSVKLLERIAVVGQELHQIPRILIQVNLSREESKSGFDASTIRAEWNDVLSFSDRVHIQGFMTMAAEADDPEAARPVFRELRELRDELRNTAVSQAKCLTLPELSMGMSGDFIPAIEEGATLIRIGSRIFEGL
ncbi:MAG: YggS family pyridoxal phosphate-dependent enzyme [Planctomycetaceae bacterium]|nr:YggS family pyridoxal phosphate-dependent enzyme [Planctomycetaceae bacterium]